MSDHLARARAEWDGYAAEYDEEPDHGLRDPAVRAAWRDLLLEHLPPAPARVADLGCGSGSLTVLLAEEGYDGHGLDLSERMLDLARAKAAAAGVDVPFTRGDASEPDLPAGSFDVVLCRHVLWALPHPADALARWVDLLRPAGRLMLLEGRWSTGAGLPARRTERLVREHRAEVTVRHLPEPAYWGGRSRTTATSWSGEPELPELQAAVARELPCPLDAEGNVELTTPDDRLVVAVGQGRGEGDEHERRREEKEFHSH